MSFSIITPIISTLLLVSYIYVVFRFMFFYNSTTDIYYSQCGATNCGNSIIQYPFGTCGLLLAGCLENQTTQLYPYLTNQFYAGVVGDITNSSYSTRTLQMTLSPQDSDPNLMYTWLTDTGFFNVSRVPGGYKVTWSISHICRSCVATGGRCYSQLHSPISAQLKNYDEYCICPNNDRLQFGNCSDDGFTYPRERINRVSIAGILFGELGAFVAVVVSCIAFHRGCCCKRTESNEERTILHFMDPLGSRPANVENFLNYYSSQVPNRYSYAQIRTYANNFEEQLGKGGFGTVYRGKLPTGRLIAVKILDESKQSEQQFIAEVGTVGSTYHVNLVRMLGFCSEGTKRALVYEYMVNGSLDKYIHGNHGDLLDWKQLYSIAIGTTRGISYLHEECRNRILHCDIKPHNVLLDDNFLSKIADFGMAKICKREESHISAAHGGTLGYAAPEMWSRMYGTVTDRSDVYSYGVLIMEMVGGRKNIDHNIDSNASKFFYAEWAFKQVEKGEFGNLMRTGHISEEDQRLIKTLCLVGLWCIQFRASRRPPMSKVIQMLEGDVEITTPPSPFPADTPPIAFSDQSSDSDQCSSTSALEVQMTDPKSTVETPPLLQSFSSNECSSSYALEVQMTDHRSIQIGNTSG